LIPEIAAARAHTDRLFAHLRPDALHERAVDQRHRFIFYLGHLEAFDRNLLAGPLELPADAPHLDRLFAFGIDPGPDPADLPTDAPGDWPAADEVRAYVARCRRALDERLAAAPAHLLHVALEHRLMHAETLCYLLHNLPPAAKRGGEPPPPCDRPAPARDLVEVPAGVARLGADKGFGWDNERPAHDVRVPAFAMERHKVTNADYLRFVRDGGPRPPFWREAQGGPRLRLMFGEIPLPPSWPVYVTHEQAAAYSRWAGMRLPTEAEFQLAAYGEDGRPYPWGSAPPEATRGNFAFTRFDPAPVDAHPLGASALGIAGLVGNGWEWTDTVFGPFAGFTPQPFYPGYSANFFDGAHFVLKGGSARTAARLLRRSFRNWFRPDSPHAYAGFRCVTRAY
jgi:formylglycine-generating enzyme required for sulfatase activity